MNDRTSAPCDHCAALREDLDNLRAAVADLRDHQREYFSLPPGSRSKSLALRASRAAEGKVDELLRRTATPALF